MSTSVPGQWLEEQRRLGNELCVTLDSQSALPALQRLLKGRAHDRYSNVYAQTVVAELAAASPFLILLDPADTESVRALCSAPQRDWGWLASLPPGALPAWTAHWRERWVAGTRPHLALYRFHDNRVLTRALAWLPEDTHPAYLGPAISVCYWAGDTWATPHNPAPGTYPVPQDPAWLHAPLQPPQIAAIRETNARRYLLDHHLPAYQRLAAQQCPAAWAHERWLQADKWGWSGAKQFETLLALSLGFPPGELPSDLHPQPHEDPVAHFERVSLTAKYWAGEGEL